VEAAVLVMEGMHGAVIGRAALGIKAALRPSRGRGEDPAMAPLAAAA